MNKPKVNKSLVETVKTVLIAVMITGVVAFVAGMHYQNNLTSDKQTAVKSAVASTLKK